MLFEEPHGRGKVLNKVYLKELSASIEKSNELVWKVASNIKGQGSKGTKGGGGGGIKGCDASKGLNYISRGGKGDKDFISLEDEFGNKLNKSEVNVLAKEWTKEFKADNKVESRKMTHFILSVNIEKNGKNKEAFEKSMRGFLKQRFGDDGYRYVFAIHDDTKQYHAHVMVNNFNLETKKKLRISKQHLQDARVMAKEHLLRHGIDMSATLKKDRVIVKQLVKEANKEYKNVNNWFEAKLKTKSNNDQHFDDMKKQWEILKEIKKNLPEQEKHTSQEKIELAQRITQLRKDTIQYEKFNSRIKANQAIREIIKACKPDRTVIDIALNRHKKLTLKEQEQEKSKLTYHAREMLKAESILKQSKTITNEDKAPLLKSINIQKKEFERRGIDISSLSKEQKIRESQSEMFKATMRELNKAIRGGEREVKANASLDPQKAEARLFRAHQATEKAINSGSLSKSEISLIKETKESLIKLHSNNGIDNQKLEKDWQLKQSFNKRVQDLKAEINKPSSDINKSQKSLLMLKKEAENIPFKPKEKITNRIALERIQTTIDQIKPTNFKRHELILTRLDKSLKTLDEKKLSRPDLANRQMFSMGKELIELGKAISKDRNLLPEQQIKLNQKLTNVTVSLNMRGANLGKLQANMEKTAQIKSDYEKLMGLTMERARAIGLARVSNQIDKVKSEIQSPDNLMKRDDKREDLKSLNNLKARMVSMSDSITMEASKLIEKIKKIESAVNKNRDALKASSLSPLEKLNIRRETEALSKQLGAMVKELKPYVRNTPDKTIATQFKQLEKQYGQSQTRMR